MAAHLLYDKETGRLSEIDEECFDNDDGGEL